MSGCHSDPAILHAVLALGAAHRSHVLAHSTSGPSNAGSFSCIAYTHYGKAIKHLQTRVSLEGAENCRTVLIACIVLLSFDLLQARYAPALVHLHHGRRILKLQYGLKANTAASNLLYLPPQTRTVDEELVYSFGQIDLQATNFGGGKPQFTFVDHPDKLDPSEHIVPDAFTSVEDAGRYIMILMNDCWRLMGLLPDNTKLNYANAEAVNHRFRLLASCERWEQAFHKGNFPHPSAESARNPDSRKAVILQMHHALITIKVSVCLSYPDEMGFDSLLPYYSKIISLASGLFPNLPTFNLDTVIIHPVFSAAIHCRHPVMRRRAVDILRRSGREGLWDSRMTALVAEEVIQHEEGHAGYCYDDQASLPADLQLADIIPRESRIAQSWMFFADGTQKILRTIHKRPKWSRVQQYPENAPNVNEDEDAWEVIEKCTPLGDD
jgi:Fungal specific transcription factor domain